jgi:hypothetical protein
VTKMTTAEKLGRIAYRSGSEKCDRLRDLYVKEREADMERMKKNCELKMKVSAEEERNINAELALRGNISEEVVKENISRAVWSLSPLVVCVAGEFVIADWTVKCFGLGEFESYVVAITVVIVSIKSVDLCIEFLRKQYRTSENKLFLVFACMGFLAVALMILFSAEIRQSLQEMHNSTSSTTLEQTVKKADDFFSQNSNPFIFLMVTLTFAFTILGGMSYHIAKNRFFVYLPLRRLYKRLKKARNELERTAELLTAQDSRVPQFLAEFETAVAEEETKEKEKKNKKSDGVKSQPVQKRKYFQPQFIPVVLLILALIFFLILRGEAKGSEDIILLDTSGSVNVNGYKTTESEFKKNVMAIDSFIRNHVLPGDTLKVIAITECSFSSPYILLDGRISPEKGAFGEVLSREKLRLLKQWESLDLKPIAKATDILGALNLTAILLSQKAGKKNLIILSDMRQCTKELNLENSKKIDVEKKLAQVKELIPNLKDVKVTCLGVHSAGKEPFYWLSLKEFWAGFFREAKAELITFSMERRYGDE